MTHQLRPLTAALAVTLLAGGCAAQKVRLPDPLQLPQHETGAANAAMAGPVAQAQAQTPDRPTGLQRVDTPAIPGADAKVLVSGMAGEPIPPLKGGAVNVNIEGMPVPAFINEFFGSILGVGFQMDPQVARMNDLVTLRTSGPQSPANFYRLAVQVLRSYGVATDYGSGLVNFRRANDAASSVPPLVVSGRALPDVPISHRPVFQLVELQAVRTQDVISLLNIAFRSDSLTIQPDPARNAVVLMGKPELVRQALDAIRILDRPFMRGRSSARLEPAFVTADELAKRLVDVLQAEGYGAALNSGGGGQSAALLVLPIAGSNTVLVFAADRALLEHAVDWARTIDKPNPAAGGNGLFYYTVRNTLAADIVKTLNGVRQQSDVQAPVRDALDNSTFASNQQVQLPPVATPVQVTNPAALTQVPGGQADMALAGGIGKGRLSLDEPRNAVIYQGEAADWARILPLIQQMDRAPRQVMIEVTVAEVTLTRNDEFGVAWVGNGGVGKYGGRFGSGQLVGQVGNAPGLRYLFDIGGQTRISLTALAQNNRINVLSTPRILVKSGQEANIDVGTEVPTISARATSGIVTDGNTGLIQTIQYRKTGVMLSIKPIIYSDDRVDLELRQEVSEAQSVGASGGLQTPAILNRSVSTMLSLKDGRSVLIGGLMQQKDTHSSDGVPYLKDVPVVGNLFKSRTVAGGKTEMVLLITPYIVESDVEVDNLTRSLSQRFELLDLPITAPQGPPIQPSQPVRP